MVGLFRENKASPSSGLRGLTILLHVCKHVDIYGMGGSTDFRNWYWDKYPGLEGKPPKDKLEKLFPRLADKEWKVDAWNWVPSSTSKTTARRLLYQKDGTVTHGTSLNVGSSISTESDTYRLQNGGTDVHVHSNRVSSLRPYVRRSLLVKQVEETKDPAHMHRGLEDRCLRELQEGGLITLRH